MRAFFGPVESLGHPFYPHPMELVAERRVGDHELYCFSNWWLERGPEVLLPEIDAIVLWDPMWLRTADWPRIAAMAVATDAPVFGIMGDWFAGHRAADELIGTRDAARACDGVLTDAPGKAAMGRSPKMGPTVSRPGFLTYGRLINRGLDEHLVRHLSLTAERDIDICHVGNRHADTVMLRAYYLDALHEICDRRGWNLVDRNDVQWPDQEAILERSKVTFNYSLGSQLNCRVYEAMACGSCLVTDAANLETGRISGIARFYSNVEMLEIHLDFLLDGGGWRSPEYAATVRGMYALEAAHWAADRSPMRTWTSIFDDLQSMLPEAREATETRDGRWPVSAEVAA